MTKIVRGPEREGGKNRSPFMISLCLHGALIAVTGIMLALSEDARDLIDRGDVLWIQDLQKKEPTRRRLQPKVPKINKDRDISFKDPDKLMKQAKNKRTEVEKLSNRKLMKDALNIDFEKTKQLPDIATEVDLPTDVTGLNRPQAILGRTDGIGDVTGRVRVKGDGDGSHLLENLGEEDGLLGGGPGGGNGGLGFITGTGDGVFTGRIVYVLDVSASMSAAGLQKLALAKTSLIDHIYRLDDAATFNIVTFAGYVSEMNQTLLDSSEKSIRRASKYLAGFTQESINRNLGTNTLAALQKACAMQPDVIVLLTDGLPTGTDGITVMTDPDVIVNAFKEANKSNAMLDIYGMEIDDRQGAPGAILLNRLAASTGGKVKFISRDELIRYKQEQLSSSR
ncbi:MAG: VWA domain-containing protein [Candidatus Poribacteria bacterium]|nr:VWA domain-containing protein [Candidatus Poribacteria bacterium]